MNLKTFFQNYVLNPYFILFAFWGLAWVLMLITGGPLISWLKRLKGMKWSPREDTPDSHLQKAGTPSMGGIGIIGSALLAFLSCTVFFTATRQSTAGIRAAQIALIYVSLFAFPLIVVLHALLGFIDDWSKARGKGGLLARQKLLGQVILAIAFVAGLTALANSVTSQSPISSTYFPTLKDAPILIAPILAILLIGTSNAVNITDGIDGLAAGLSTQVALVFTFLLFGNWYAPIQLNEYGAYAANFWMCLGGACLGFLIFNKYPAKVFMGDTGSLALGAALGAGAILTRSVFLLPFIGFIFFIEMFSVVAQVAYFKYTKKKHGEGKRIFRRAPLHHHFELGGWSEWRVVGTFWAINALTTILGLILWKVGILPRFP